MTASIGVGIQRQAIDEERLDCVAAAEEHLALVGEVAEEGSFRQSGAGRRSPRPSSWSNPHSGKSFHAPPSRSRPRASGFPSRHPLRDPSDDRKCTSRCYGDDSNCHGSTLSRPPGGLSHARIRHRRHRLYWLCRRPRSPRRGPRGRGPRPLGRLGGVSRRRAPRSRPATLDDLDVLRSTAAASDGVIHLAFKHEEAFAGGFQAAADADRRAIEVLGEALGGSGRRLSWPPARPDTAPAAS